MLVLQFWNFRSKQGGEVFEVEGSRAASSRAFPLPTLRDSSLHRTTPGRFVNFRTLVHYPRIAWSIPVVKIGEEGGLRFGARQKQKDAEMAPLDGGSTSTVQSQVTTRGMKRRHPDDGDLRLTKRFDLLSLGK
jgi:hypothetical protein